MLSRWLPVIGLILIIPLISAFGILQTQVPEETSADAETAPVLDVNGYLVTERDYLLTVNAVESNLDYMRSDEVAASPWVEFNEAYAKLISETGTDVVGLAGDIAEAAVYQWGIDHGLEVSQSELDAALEAQRQIVATADDPSVEGRRAFIAEIGEDLYWSEIAPRTLKLDLMSELVREANIDDEQSADEKRDQWRAFQTEIILNANITSLDTDRISPAMIEQAVRYLTEDIPALYAEYPSS